MKPEQILERALRVVPMILGLLLALYIAKLVGSGDFTKVQAIVAALALFALLLLVKEKVWVLVPVCWTMLGQTDILNMPIAYRDMAVAYVAVSFVALIAFKLVKRKPTFGLLDVLILINLIWLAQAYIRNPVGFQALGSPKVGGRPYVNVVLACLSLFILSLCSVSFKQRIWIPLLITGGRMVEGVLSSITNLFPGAYPVISRFYSTVDSMAYLSTDVTIGPSFGTTNRKFYLQYLGNPVCLALISFCRPSTLTNPLYIGRVLLFAVGATLVLYSGFRSFIAALIFYFAVACIVRKQVDELIRVIIISIPILTLVIMMNGLVYNLPLPAQRALSFLPGNWDPLAAHEAKESTRWRLVIWNEVLYTDRYIANKWLGDGFGFTRRELDIMRYIERYGTTEQGQENLLINGDYHSGPLTTIRVVGYIGLVLFFVLLFVLAKQSWVAVMRARGSPFLPLALFVCLPSIWEPINYLFIFGGFNNNLPDTIFRVGMLKMLINTLDDYERFNLKQGNAQGDYTVGGLRNPATSAA